MAKRYEQGKRYTEKYKDILLPCRYCGNTSVHIVSDRGMFGDQKVYWSVVCETTNCDCTSTFTKVVDAVNRWNEKHSQHLSVKERHEYERIMASCVHGKVGISCGTLTFPTAS